MHCTVGCMGETHWLLVFCKGAQDKKLLCEHENTGKLKCKQRKQARFMSFSIFFDEFLLEQRNQY